MTETVTIRWFSLHAGGDGALRLALLRDLRKPVITSRADGNGRVGGAVKVVGICCAVGCH